jgi:hypothetical protein
MAQTYTFPIPAGRDVAELLEKAKAAGKSRRIAFTGDEKAGRFQGVAEGTYAVDGAQLTIVVDKKPAFVPWMMIENALKDLFGGG